MAGGWIPTCAGKTTYCGDIEMKEREASGELPVIVRVTADQVLLDVRTLDSDEFAGIRDALTVLVGEKAGER
jgi:hypothetical protein